MDILEYVSDHNSQFKLSHHTNVQERLLLVQGNWFWGNCLGFHWSTTLTHTDLRNFLKFLIVQRINNWTFCYIKKTLVALITTYVQLDVAQYIQLIYFLPSKIHLTFTKFYSKLSKQYYLFIAKKKFTQNSIHLVKETGRNKTKVMKGKYFQWSPFFFLLLELFWRGSYRFVDQDEMALFGKLIHRSITLKIVL